MNPNRSRSLHRRKQWNCCNKVSRFDICLSKASLPEFALTPIFYYIQICIPTAREIEGIWDRNVNPNLNMSQKRLPPDLLVKQPRRVDLGRSKRLSLHPLDTQEIAALKQSSPSLPPGSCIRWAPSARPPLDKTSYIANLRALILAPTPRRASDDTNGGAMRLHPVDMRASRILLGHLEAQESPERPLRLPPVADCRHRPTPRLSSCRDDTPTSHFPAHLGSTQLATGLLLSDRRAASRGEGRVDREFPGKSRLKDVTRLNHVGWGFSPAVDGLDALPSVTQLRELFWHRFSESARLAPKFISPNPNPNLLSL